MDEQPKQEEWQRRYTHERDVRDAQLEHLGLPPIKDAQFGVLTAAPKSAWYRFNGLKFWPILEAKGHTATAFEECECSLKKGGG